jgi:hydrazine synthase alpha subunit-like protein
MRPSLAFLVVRRTLAFAIVLQLAAAAAGPTAALADTVSPLPYPLLYVRAPYFGPTARNSVWPDTVRPLIPDAGATLVLLSPAGTREVLFPLAQHRAAIDTPAGKPLSVGSVADPNVSFDGRWVLFTWYHDLTDGNGQRDNLSWLGADLYKLNLQTRELVRLTVQQHTPNTGNGANFDPNNPQSNFPRIGVFNTGGTWAPGGRIVFTSSRNDLLPPKAFNLGQRTLQLFVMRDDGSNVEQIGHLNLAMALHPQVLMGGRIAFSSWEEHGIRDSRQFPLWAIGPDGRAWTSLSGYSENAIVHHFATQMPDGDVVVCRYYNLNNNGFGDLVRYPIDPPGQDFGTDDPPPGSGTIPFERVGQLRLAPFTTPDDFPAPCPGWEDNPYGSSVDPTICAGSARRGKLTHPAATPNAAGNPAQADLLAVYAPGPANHNGIAVGAGTTTPWYHGEIVLLPDGAPIPVPSAGQPGRPPQLLTVLAEDGFNLQWPRPVVTYQQLYGIVEPAGWPALDDDEVAEEDLVPGEPFGLIGSSSLLWRDTEPALGQFQPDRDPFNTTREFLYGWVHQGADAGVYADDDVYAVRILMQQAQTDRLYPNNGPEYEVVGGERMRILGELPVRGPLSGKPGGATVRHPDGALAADTSFLAKVPADTSITFQALDRRGMVLNMAQTWHQVRPGEARYDCGGCHAHSKPPLDFELTAAAHAGYPVRDLARTTPLLAFDAAGEPSLQTVAAHAVTVEYFRDVVPILQARCASCHGGGAPAAGLVLSSSAPPVNGRPRAYWQLVADTDGWFEPQLTRYVRAFQSRQSLLLWKVWGQRLDGRTNGARTDDLDYVPSPQHPDGVGVAGMTTAEKMTLARWIDLGAGIQLGSPWGFLEDDLRSTLVLRPSAEEALATGTVAALEIAAFDVESGVVGGSLEVVADVPLGPFPAGSNLAAGAALDPEGAVLRLVLPRAVSPSERATFRVRVRDAAGHWTELRRTFGAAAGAPPWLLRDGFETGNTSAWGGGTSGGAP